MYLKTLATFSIIVHQNKPSPKQTHPKFNFQTLLFDSKCSIILVWHVFLFSLYEFNVYNFRFLFLFQIYQKSKTIVSYSNISPTHNCTRISRDLLILCFQTVEIVKSFPSKTVILELICGLGLISD